MFVHKSNAPNSENNQEKTTHKHCIGLLIMQCQHRNAHTRCHLQLSMSLLDFSFTKIKMDTRVKFTFTLRQPKRKKLFCWSLFNNSHASNFISLKWWKSRSIVLLCHHFVSEKQKKNFVAKMRNRIRVHTKKGKPSNISLYAFCTILFSFFGDMNLSFLSFCDTHNPKCKLIVQFSFLRIATHPSIANMMSCYCFVINFC